MLFITCECLVTKHVLLHIFSSRRQWEAVNGKIRLLSPRLYCKWDSLCFPIRASAPEGRVWLVIVVKDWLIPWRLLEWYFSSMFSKDSIYIYRNCCVKLIDKRAFFCLFQSCVVSLKSQLSYLSSATGHIDARNRLIKSPPFMVGIYAAVWHSGWNWNKQPN